MRLRVKYATLVIVDEIYTEVKFYDERKNQIGQSERIPVYKLGELIKAIDKKTKELKEQSTADENGLF
ncbi:hypothetical protein KDD93_07510 [Campylobacter sp. faydin G-24]|uniref:Uncharacterized protein n=1 Tax=Campylobacter anatolicus TaxID=2829105 RepID=A0ABS5HJF7_9BACT|nr:hypothetical protein [Campylobacter anatolicus]MBR8464409.1 hypothetical protein [Campylobacter anatolicus]